MLFPRLSSALVVIGLGLAGFCPPVQAQFGGAVIVVQDSTWYFQDLPKWEQLLFLTDTHMEKTAHLNAQAEKIIDRTETIVRLLGETAAPAEKYVGTVASILEPVQRSVELETEKHAVDSGRNLFGPGSRAVKTHKAGNEVDRTYAAVGQTHRRDEARFRHFAAHEALYARYRTAAKNDEAVVRQEFELQQDALARVKRARTISEVTVFNAVISASKQRQDLAHQQTQRAKGDLEAFRAQLALEDDRKAEADREWAQTVIDRMRAKALAAYRAQQAGGGGANSE